MSFTGYSPQIDQGSLNRILAHLTVTSFPNLNVTSSYMGKDQLTLTFDEDSIAYIKTATGVVNSPEPYVLAKVEFSLLRSQSLSNTWIQQLQSQCVLGSIGIFPDSTVMDSFQLTDTSIMRITPGPFNGSDPGVKITLQGTFQVNSSMWAAVTGAAGILPQIV